MIHQIFDSLRTELNTFLMAQSAPNLEAKVEFLSDEPSDAVKFPSNSICPILLRVEEEKTMRLEDRYLRSKDPRNFTSAHPGVPMHLYIMFVARYKNYLEGLKNLSHVIRFFQGNPFISKGLPANVPDLRIELHTPSSTALNEIWGVLRAPLHPSVIYRVSLLMMELEAPSVTGKVVRPEGATHELGELKK